MKRSSLARRTPLKRTGRLRALSPKRRAALPDWKAIYAEVDARSGGWCELGGSSGQPPPWTCMRRATEHHHCRKPRASHHTAALVLHLCREHHRMADAPYRSGRLVTRPTASGIAWAILRRRDKWSQQAEVLASGTVAFAPANAPGG